MSNYLDGIQNAEGLSFKKKLAIIEKLEAEGKVDELFTDRLWEQWNLHNNYGDCGCDEENNSMCPIGRLEEGSSSLLDLVEEDTIAIEDLDFNKIILLRG